MTVATAAEAAAAPAAVVDVEEVSEKQRVQAAVSAHRQAGYKCVQCRGPLRSDKTLCGACRGVYYCGKPCQVEHWRANHKIACQLYHHILSKLTHTDLPFTFPLKVKPLKYDEWLEAQGVLGKGLWRRESQSASAYAYGQLPEAPEEELWGLAAERLPAPLARPLADGQPEFPGTVLKSWQDYYTLRQLPLDSPIAVLLSIPLTLYYALTQCLPDRILKRPDLRIYLLGAERELDQTLVLGELAHLLPDTRFHITLVGPMVHADMRAADPHPRVRLSFRRGHYHELCQAEGAGRLRPADLVIAPNASLETNPNWRPTVHLLAQQKCPAFFTDQCETSTLNATRMFATVGAREAFQVRLNPFRAPVWREAEVHAMPCYSNGFLQAVNLQ